MFNLLKTKTNLKQLEIIAKKLASKSLIGDIYLLSGELGSGKTTFIRFFIYSIFARHLIKKPNSIKSPSFPIMINYPIKNFEVFHYDLYRLKNIKEISVVNFDHQDVIRHPLVTKIVEAYQKNTNDKG